MSQSRSLSSALAKLEDQEHFVNLLATQAVRDDQNSVRLAIGFDLEGARPAFVFTNEELEQLHALLQRVVKRERAAVCSAVGDWLRDQ